VAKNLKTVITRDQAIARFIEGYAPGILEAERKYDHVGGPDLPMRREAWSNYVDVILSVEGEKVWCGNYTQGHFEVIA